MRPWKVAIIVGSLAAVGLLAAVAIASGADKSAIAGDRNTACDGSGTALRSGDGSGGSGRGFGASSEMRAWRDQYGADPTSPEAQAALDLLRAQHQAENQEEAAGGGFGDGSGSSVDDADACSGDGYGRQGSGYGQGGGNDW